MLDPLKTLQAQLDALHQRIQTYALQYGKDPAAIHLLAVSKGQSVIKIQDAIAAGIRAFGENYLQEALPKIEALSTYPQVEWHFIGPLQSNKLKKIAIHFQWVHTVNSLQAAVLLNKHRPSHLPPLQVCLQVNTSGEATKSGIAYEQTESLAHAIRALPQLTLRGLMVIPAIKPTLLEQREQFQPLVKLFSILNQKGYALDILSMGMSDDMEAAIAEGSNLLRIGTALFGAREIN